MDNFNYKKYLAEGRLYENNDSVGMINYLKSLPDQYDMSDSQYDLWEDTMESIEGFTSQEIKNYIKDLPNLWDMSGSQYDLWEDIMDNFDLKKDLAEGKLSHEEQLKIAFDALDNAEMTGDIRTAELALAFIDMLNDGEEKLQERLETGVIGSAKSALKSMPMSDVYIKSLESDVEKHGEGGYEGFENDDWIEDYSEFIVDKLDS